MNRFLSSLLVMVVLISGCTLNKKEDDRGLLFASRFKRENTITLSDEEMKLNGNVIDENGDVFVSHDIVYYEQKDIYESGNAYGEGTEKDMHTEEEAKSHRVLNITKSGAYRISGKLSAGQIRVDLGEDALKNPDAVVELILDNADITCTIAPAILFLSVYECDEDWTVEEATFDVDTSKAGAVLVLADGSENHVHGSYVEKIFKDEVGEKKLWKQDGAIYSYMSMNVFGAGSLNLFSDNEGLDTEHHLTINGGDINIYSDNDGINTNEDGVSVTTINGGNLNIVAGLGAEGDGIDSNGWLVINGGHVISKANPIADSGLDSDLGSYINGGTVVAYGSAMDWPESDSNQVTINLQFAKTQKAESEIVIKNSRGENVFAYKADGEDMSEVKIRGFRGAVISCPVFAVGETYMVYVDGVKQGYTETDFKGRPGGEFRGEKPGNPPASSDKDRPEPPQGEFPEGAGPIPTDDEPDRIPDGAEGMIPKGEWSPEPLEDKQKDAEQKDVFFMEDKVNCFSFVANCSKS